MNTDSHKVAILVPNYFTPLNLDHVLSHLPEVDSIDVISSESRKVKSWDKTENTFHNIVLYDNELKRLSALEYDSLMIHEDLINVPREDVQPETVHFINKFMGRKKPIMVLCQDQWTVVTGNKKNAFSSENIVKISAA